MTRSIGRVPRNAVIIHTRGTLDPSTTSILFLDTLANYLIISMKRIPFVQSDQSDLTCTACIVEPSLQSRFCRQDHPRNDNRLEGIVPRSAQSGPSLWKRSKRHHNETWSQAKLLPFSLRALYGAASMAPTRMHPGGRGYAPSRPDRIRTRGRRSRQATPRPYRGCADSLNTSAPCDDRAKPAEAFDP